MARTPETPAPPATRRAKAATSSAPDLNLVVLTGNLSSDPVLRTLPSGDQLHQYEVTSRPAVAGEPSATSPVVWFGERSGSAGKAGDSVIVVGSVRRRFFRSGGITQSRTEVIASRLTISPNKRSRSAALKRAAEVIANSHDGGS